MPLQCTKPMSELSMLTILIQAAAIVKNRDGDKSLHGYVEEHGLKSRGEMTVDFAVLDSIGDVLLQSHQVLAVSPNKRDPGAGIITSVLVSEWKADSELEIPAEHPIRVASKVSSPISATVVPNPNDRCCHGNDEDGQLGGVLGNIRQVSQGKSMWDMVKKDPLFYAVDMDVSTPKGLADHAETLSDYLHEYGENKDQRSKHSEHFFDYLLSACWEKLHRRFCSWQGLGFIRNFEERIDLLTGHLDMFSNESFMDRGPGDRTLTQFLYLNKEVIFGTMLPLVFRDSSSQSSMQVFDKLRDAVIKAYNEDSTCIYTKDTVLGFHYLAYSAFLLAGQAIREIKDHQAPLKNAGANLANLKKKNEAGVKKDAGAKKKEAKKEKLYNSLGEAFRRRISAAVLPMKFLQCVLSSTMFKRHIKIWTNNGESLDELLPKWWQKKDNLLFGKKRHILAASKTGPSEEESPTESGDEDGDIPKERLSEVDKDSDHDDNDNDNDNEPPEMSGASGLQMFFGWVRLFVGHFLGKRNLEVYTAQLASVHLNQRPEIRVFAVSSEIYQVPAWKEFEKVIQDALVDTPIEETAKIIRILQERVDSGVGLNSEARQSVNGFRLIMTQKKETWTLIMHCEAVVAALLEFRKDRPTVSSTDPESSFLAELSKNLADNMVSVSKLCCPVCWELFQVLGREDTVRGCHPIVTPIALPQTFPKHVSEALVTRFRAHLSSQLRHLSSSGFSVSELKNGHHRITSESGYSATSSNEGATKISNASEQWLMVHAPGSKVVPDATL